MLYSFRKNIIKKLAEAKKNNGHSTEYQKAQAAVLLDVLHDLNVIIDDAPEPSSKTSELVSKD